ncbi:MAG: MlaD family protein, partial [Bacteroidota bacterium]
MKISKEAKVGLLAITALTIVYTGINFLKGQDLLSTGNTYYTMYQNSIGLKTSSPVLVNGIAIGRVKKIEILPEKGYSALVTFQTEKNIKLTDVTLAKLVGTSLLGAKAVELIIKPGNPVTNYATIPGLVEPSLQETFTQTALPVLHDAKDVSLVVSKFVNSVAENAAKINAIFNNVEDATSRLKKTIASNEKNVTVLSQGLAEIADSLADHKDGIHPLLIKLNKMIDGMQSGAVSSIITKLNVILSNVETFLNTADNTKKNSLSRLTKDDELYNNLN